VAALALYVAVLAGERKLGLAVIKQGVFPVLFGMAVRAGLAERALVLVVLLVTGVAVGWGFTMFFAFRMTVPALDLRTRVPAL
jgi:hypothetical protein